MRGGGIAEHPSTRPMNNIGRLRVNRCLVRSWLAVTPRKKIRGPHSPCRSQKCLPLLNFAMIDPQTASRRLKMTLFQSKSPPRRPKFALLQLKFSLFAMKASLFWTTFSLLAMKMTLLHSKMTLLQPKTALLGSKFALLQTKRSLLRPKMTLRHFTA
jgi:hypothetical protein